MKLKTLKPRIATMPDRLTPAKSARESKRKFYDTAAWRFRIRPQQLERHPLCEDCLARGLTVPALHVDHRDNNVNNNAPENLASRCVPCHSSKTVKVDGGFGNPRGVP